jgi:triosephosphate isomerase (TIM)
MRKRVIGNWKMNGTIADLPKIAQIAAAVMRYPNVDSGLCLPATLISAAHAYSPQLQIGGQDCHMQEAGAHTGCISAAMLLDAGASMVILGHSECRAEQGQSDADVRAKALAAMQSNLFAIICVGESEAQRDLGNAEKVVLDQIEGSLPDICDAAMLCVAYEPIWAIGTGRIPSSQDVENMHGAIRSRLIERQGEGGKNIGILYGGSMNGENAGELMAIPNVDGGLIGGASLLMEKFEPILAAANIEDII